MEHVVKSILCKYLPQFNDIQVEDLAHQYSKISEKKLEIVSNLIFSDHRKEASTPVNVEFYNMHIT